MRFASFVVACALLTGCSSESSRTEPDAAIADTATVAADTAVADTRLPTDTRELCEKCVYGICPDVTTCESAKYLTSGARLTEDTAIGGAQSDCASHASGLGGPSLYYAIDLPPKAFVRVLATTRDPEANVMIRVLPDCTALATENGALGGKTTDGKAMVCLRDDDATASRRIILAISRYSPSEAHMTIPFDLAFDVLGPSEDCVF